MHAQKGVRISGEMQIWSRCVSPRPAAYLLIREHWGWEQGETDPSAEGLPCKYVCLCSEPPAPCKKSGMKTLMCDPNPVKEEIGRPLESAPRQPG